jgi:oligopeptide/dipeptide ABC transporter ATP-binding protein
MATRPDPAAPVPRTIDAILRVRGLRTSFAVDGRSVPAVDGVDLDLAPGRTLCIVGESGSGKSVTALSIMGLIAPPGRVEATSIGFDGQELTRLDAAARRDLRGDRMAMIFQEPMTALNPAFRVGDQIAEILIRHRAMDAKAARARAIEALKQVRIPSPEERIDQYPHQLSGGMRQRVMIAMAIACNPALLIADEPTTALDVTIQAQVLDLLRALRAETGMAVMLITHDLGVVAEVADHVMVMYAGKIVESADVNALFHDPQHPYTLGLLSSIPRLAEERERLPAIDGTVPPPHRMPKGCRFNPRCVFADARCRDQEPPLAELVPGHRVACWKAPVETHG